MLRVLVGTLLAARHSVEVGNTAAHKDVPALLVLGIDFVLQTWAHIHIGFASTLAAIRTAAVG